jgi:tight adherence protein B
MPLVLPIAVLGIGGAVAMLFFAYWEAIVRGIAKLLEPFIAGLDRAAIPAKSEELAVAVLVLAIVPWGLFEIFGRPNWVVAVGLLLLTISLSFLAVRFWINRRVVARLREYNEQLEMVLRLIAGTMRVGLGMRQAIVQVVTDMPDPSRVEFSRVIGQTQVGVSLYDALDSLAARMPSSEMTLFANTVRLQSQTGGSLARLLENLANTIKERRRLERKIKTLTSEARMTRHIITALPVLLFIWLVALEPPIRQGLLFTLFGRVVMVVVVVLLVIGWFVFDWIGMIDI